MGGTCFKNLIPVRLRDWLRPFYYRLYTSLPEPPREARNKYDSELAYWRGRWESEGRRFGNSHYRRLMLAIANEPDDAFVRGRVVGDFGCGPRGSLAWAKGAALRVGIDVLACRYADAFEADIRSHGMVYVTCTEKVVPVPSDFFDVVLTVNAMDHVDDFRPICDEILRILKPGGVFAGSFNLNEPPTRNEPQCLDETAIKTNLLDRMDVEFYRAAPAGPEADPYKHHFEPGSSIHPGERGSLWVRARKR